MFSAFGQNFKIKLPLDFNLDPRDFPVEISLDSGDNVPELSIGWRFNLAFGYDETEGFFLFTFPDEGDVSEFEIEALLSVQDSSLNASLFFLDVALAGLNIDVGAKLFVDVDKSSALRKEDVAGPNFGRVTQGDFSKITQISDLFVIGALAGATLEVEDAEIGLNIDELEDINEYIPKLNFGIAAHFRKEFDIKDKASSTSSTSNRRLLHDGNRRLVGRLHEGSDHRALPLLRSLQGQLEAEDEKITSANFAFDPCPADGINKTACAVVTNITLDVNEITKLVSPVVDYFVNNDKTGQLDEIIGPLEPLRQPIPGISEITNKDLSILDVAEAFDRVGSGVATVRKMFGIYDGMRSLAEQLAGLEDIVLATECDVLDSFNCTGGLSDDNDDVGRRLLDVTYHDPFGSSVDEFGLPMTPRLLTTDCSFTAEDCEGESISCGQCPSAAKKAKCVAALLKCKAGAIEGLSFPILSDPIGALALLSGGDIVSFSRFECDKSCCRARDSPHFFSCSANCGLFAARGGLFLQQRAVFHLVHSTRMHFDNRLRIFGSTQGWLCARHKGHSRGGRPTRGFSKGSQQSCS